MASIPDGVILLVEDNPDDAELTLRAFQENNILNNIVIARDGAEALHYIFGTGPHAGRDVSQMPQVVLLDLKLPRVDGHEVLRRIRADERTKHQPVVILTSSQEDEDVVAAYEGGANSYVRKPVDFNDFLDATRQLGMYWLVLNERPPAKE
jgi:two-component system, response regulator